MDIVPMVLAGFGGVILGGLLTSRVLSWLQMIIETRSAAQVAGHSSLAPMLAAILLHSGPWLLTGTLVFGYFAFSRSGAEGWTWFFSGVVIAPLLLIPSAIVISRRDAKSKQQTPSNAA